MASRDAPSSERNSSTIPCNRLFSRASEALAQSGAGGAAARCDKRSEMSSKMLCAEEKRVESLSLAALGCAKGNNTLCVIIVGYGQVSRPVCARSCSHTSSSEGETKHRSSCSTDCSRFATFITSRCNANISSASVARADSACSRAISRYPFPLPRVSDPLTTSALPHRKVNPEDEVDSLVCMSESFDHFSMMRSTSFSFFLISAE